MSPLILTEEEWMSRQAEFAEYDKPVSQACVNQVLYSPPGTKTEPAQIDAKSITAHLRKIVLDELMFVAKKGESPIPLAPVWGPTVKSADAVTIYFKLVPAGTEEQHESTDGVRLMPPSPASSLIAPPPLPSADAIAVPPKVIMPQESRIDYYLAQANDHLAKEKSGKLYRATGLVEVTAEDVNAEMSSRRKNAKPAVYIRGTIVEPKLKVEI